MKKKSIKRSINLASVEVVQNKIYLIKNRRVMVDVDLALLYGVETKVLIQAVKRNMRRFPSDFMFQLNKQEYKILRSQFVTSSWGGRRYLPYVFTEQGVAMLSSVINSDRAIEVNIQIMRVFVKLKELMLSHKDLARKIMNLEEQFKNHDQKFVLIFEAIRKLLQSHKEPRKSRAPIGFHVAKS